MPTAQIEPMKARAVPASGSQRRYPAQAMAAGAVLGTYVGAAFRAGLAKAFGKDLPAALIEDLVAIGGAWLIVHGI